MILREHAMKHESELVTAVNDGFKKWLNLPELKAYIEQERLKVSTTPELFMIAFNTTRGFEKLEAGVVKMTSVVDELGKLVDIELYVTNDQYAEAVKFNASLFQPDAHPQIQFCRIFGSRNDRDDYYENIRFLSDLNNDYKQATINLLRKQAGF